MGTGKRARRRRRVEGVNLWNICVLSKIPIIAKFETILYFFVYFYSMTSSFCLSTARTEFIIADAITTAYISTAPLIIQIDINSPFPTETHPPSHPFTFLTTL